MQIIYEYDFMNVIVARLTVLLKDEHQDHQK
jgi:hypothetical protein